jgi:hypothetical protein
MRLQEEDSGPHCQTECSPRCVNENVSIGALHFQTGSLKIMAGMRTLVPVSTCVLPWRCTARSGRGKGERLSGVSECPWVRSVSGDDEQCVECARAWSFSSTYPSCEYPFGLCPHVDSIDRQYRTFRCG